MRSQLRAAAEVADRAIARAIGDGALEADAGVLRRAGWRPQLSAAQVATRGALLARLAGAGAEPPSVAELGAELGASVPALLRLLEREGHVVAVDAERVYEVRALSALVERLRSGTDGVTVYTPADMRDVLGLSRRLLIPFLEYCDRAGITERLAEGRRVRPAGAAGGRGATDAGVTPG